ncbi:RNA polymerase I enhancer binding protein, partial [Coemansia sp. RSA 1836]
MTLSRNIDAYDDDGNDGDGDDNSSMVAALAEMLRLYSGLMSDSVEAAAKALTQAKLAASEVQPMRGGGRQDALRRVQQSRSVVNATAATLRQRSVHASTAASASAISAAAADDDDDEQQQHHNQNKNQRRGAGRRWFTQEHLTQMQRDGVVFTKGKFTAAENAVIEAAIAGFVSGHGLTQQQIYDHLFRHKTRDSTGKQLRKAFWPILAEALPRRQIQAIYHHVRRRCHPLNHLGAWTVDEDDALRRLVAAHGPAWEAISGEMGRMGTNCRDRWRYIQSQGAQNGGGRALA